MKPIFNKDIIASFVSALIILTTIGTLIFLVYQIFTHEIQGDERYDVTATIVAVSHCDDPATYFVDENGIAGKINGIYGATGDTLLIGRIFYNKTEVLFVPMGSSIINKSKIYEDLSN